MKKILFSMACGPYPQIDNTDSMDLYTSRLTKGQEFFTLKSYYPAMPVYLLAQNVSIPSVALEYPSFDDFVSEVKKGYDYIGINFNTIFFDSTYKMCKAIKELSPETKIILGGYGVTCLKEEFQEEKELISMADYICHGEGIRFVREILGEPIDGEIKQDFPKSYIYTMGEKIVFDNAVSALGCRGACEFCCTSAFYDYKKVRIVNPGALWKIVKGKLLEGSTFVWIYDEDFFADADYVREFGSLIKKDRDIPPEKVSWAGFGSIRSISQYSIEELVEMGVSAIWIGVESKFSTLPKRQGRDIKETFKDLMEAGIQTVGSFIIGWDFQTEDNIMEDISHFVQMNPTYTQISSLMPCPETRLWEKLKKEGKLYTENFRWNKHHLYSIMHRHTNIKDEDVIKYVNLTQTMLYEQNGPSFSRTFEVNLKGYINSRNSSNEIIRKRAALFASWCRKIFPALLAVEIHAPSAGLKKRIRMLRKNYVKELGNPSLDSRIKAFLFLIYASILRICNYFQKKRKAVKNRSYMRRSTYNGAK
ncbi:MAG TPA: hypothetical protein PKN36_07665 [bacterium]|nr:hypothetical protein [bacterium]